MRRTSIPLLVTIAVLAGAVGWLGQVALAASGQATLTPPSSLIVAMFAIGFIVLALGWPIRQWVRGKRNRVIDPFRAMRVLLLAKASSFTGSLFAGASAGLLLYGFTRDVLPATGSLASTVLVLVGSALAAVAGVVVELWCRLPPDDEAQAMTAAPEVQA